MKQIVDTIIENAKLWEVSNSQNCYKNCSVIIDQGKILAIENSEDLFHKYEAAQRWDACGKVLFPGFINTHCHLFQTFIRGLGKDLPFIGWMNNSVRLMMPEMDEEAVYLAAMVGCMEALRSGTTTLLDFMYATVRPQLADAVLQAFDEIGIRGILARGLTDVPLLPGSSVPPSTGAPVAKSIQDHDRLRAQYKDHKRISFMMAPSVIWGMTYNGLKAVAEYAISERMPVTMHLLETVDDDQFSLKNYGKRTCCVLEDTGILATKFLAVHAIKTTEADLTLFETYHTNISHNPVANMILGSGVAPVIEYVKRGIPVSLGTDGAASNDSQNLLEVMKTTALLQKVHHLDSAAISAEQVFSMATLQGAQTIGMENEIGSLCVGKQADILVIDLQQPNTTPSYQPISSLVYSGSDRNVNAVFVEGQLVYENGKFSRIDEEKILNAAQIKAQAMYVRAKGC